jgi:DNA polymerase-1
MADKSPKKKDPSTSSGRVKDRQKRLVLLDSHAIIHRAYHALPEFSNSKGEPTGALYGIATMLMKIVTDLKPDYVVAAYDLPKPTFRHEAYTAYKGTRTKTDDNLVAQLQSSRKLFEAFNIPMYDAPGFEADDVIGTVVEHMSVDDKKHIDTIIASGDMDTLQLVDDDRVRVFTLKKGINDTILYNEKAVKERFGFGPKLLPDYKGLRGDPSDNIIGIKGIGEKTATDLIVNFGTIENMYKKLKKDEAAFLKVGIKPRIIELLKTGEEEALFSKTLATIRRDAPVAFVLPEKTFMDGVEADRIERLFRELEFRSLVPRVKKVFGFEQQTLDANGEEEDTVTDTDPEETKRIGLALWLLNSDLTNITFDDISHYAGAQNFEEGKKKILSDIQKNGLSYVYEEIELPILPVVKAMEDRGILINGEYMQKISKEAHKELDIVEKNIWKLAGREFNVSSPKQLGEIIFDELKVGDGTGTRLKKTEGGARSTRESELQKLIDMHPIIPEILKYRELSKLLSTYIDTLPALAGPDGRIHAQFRQAGTTTGRFSSINPNLQNIPASDGLAKKIRESFVSAPGHMFVAFDYSQIELRIAAVLSGDDFLIDTFVQKKDIHSAVASRVFGVPESEVTKDMRRKAKVINFGILYGMGVTALQANLGTSRKEAQEFYNSYFESFPKIAGYMDSTTEFAKKNGYTETLYGRKRYFKDMRSPLPFIRAAAERQAGNAPIQGTATADCIKLAIQDANEALKKAKLLDKAHLVLQVHDELVYEVENDAVAEVAKLVEKVMEDVMEKRPEFLKGKRSVPIEVHVATGKNWGELK